MLSCCPVKVKENNKIRMVNVGRTSQIMIVSVAIDPFDSISMLLTTNVLIIGATVIINKTIEVTVAHSRGHGTGHRILHMIHMHPRLCGR